MKYFVKIDRDTIRRNPAAGSTVAYVLGKPVETRTVDPDGTLRISVSQPHQVVHTLRQANYLMRWENPQVVCEYCKAAVPVLDLDYAETDEPAWACTDRMCPECNAWDCCEVVYEKMTDEQLETIILIREEQELAELNGRICCMRFERNPEGGFRALASDGAEFEPIELPTRLHLISLAALVAAIESDPAFDSDPYRTFPLEDAGRKYEARTISGPGGEVVLHVYQGDRFLFHVETRVNL